MSSSLERFQVGDRVTIYTRGKKSLYQADFHYRGQHRRKSLKTTNRREAVKVATELAHQILNGTLDDQKVATQTVTVDRTKLPAAVAGYLESQQVSGNRPKTLTKYRGTLNGFNEFALSRKIASVDQVSLMLIDQYKQDRSKQLVRGKKIGRTQLYHDLALLKRFFKWCLQRGMTTTNPLAEERVSRPTQRRRECSPTLDQLEAIMAALPSRIHAPVAVLAFSGMRSANCRNLLVSDVDLKEGWIHVRSREGAETKGGNEWKVPIHRRLAAVLERLPIKNSGYLFTAPASTRYPQGGHWINTTHLNDDFVKVVKTLGMPAGRESGFTIHSLRHFFKSYCVSHGVPREYVDAWQGHASIRTPSDLYVHTFDHESQRWMSQVPFGEAYRQPMSGQKKE